MENQSVFMSKRFGTQIAFVRLLASVHSYMNMKKGLCRKLLRTLATTILVLASVNFHMENQLVFSSK